MSHHVQAQNEGNRNLKPLIPGQRPPVVQTS